MFNLTPNKQLQQNPNNEDKKVLPLPEGHIDFYTFCRFFSYPLYRGLYKWQEVCHNLTWNYKYQDREIPRDHGKSILLSAEMQWGMKCEDYDVLLLGWTDRRKEVAEYVYIFHEYNHLVLTDNRTSQFHFKTTYGARFDCYLITSKEILGKHSLGDQLRFANLSAEDKALLQELYKEMTDQIIKEYIEERKDSKRKLLIVIDDPIDDSFRDEIHKEATLERRYDSTIANINADKVILNGTKKFEDDFFYFFKGKYSKHENYIEYKRTPYLERTDPLYNKDLVNNPENILCPEKWSVEKLDLKRAEIGEYWWSAEYMQDPHPQVGGMVDANDLDWVKSIPSFLEAQVVGVSLDCTENELDSGDMAAIVSCAMYGKDYPEFTFINADVRKMPFRDFVDKRDGKTYKGIMETISMHVKFLELHYPRQPIIIAIERKGGGLYVIREAFKDPHLWWWCKYIIGEKDKAHKFYQEINALGINHSKEKVGRVFSELQYPIKQKRVHFHEGLFGSVFVTQLLGFPRARFDDGPDAGGMIKDELLKLWTPTHDLRPVGLIKEEKKRENYHQQYIEAKNPWIKDIKMAKQRYRK